MKTIALCVGLTLVGLGHAQADCAARIDAAMQRARALPATPGRAALMEQILRADNEHHEGDEEGCVEELSVAEQALAETHKP